MTVTVGAYSLIVPDPNEQYIPALSMKVHESYNTVTKLNDVALIQVKQQRQSTVCAVDYWITNQLLK